MARITGITGDENAEAGCGSASRKAGLGVTSLIRVYPGWWVVLTAAFALFLGPIPIAVLSFGVFFRPLAGEFHAGRSAVSFAFTLHNLALAIAMPFAGRLVNRFGAKKVIVTSTILVGVTLLASNLCSGKIWQLYLFYVAMGLLESAAGPLPYSDVITHWFDRHRGLALGVMMFGLSLGAFVMPPLTQHWITQVGWRGAFTIVGLVVLLLTVPIIAIFLKERPQPARLPQRDQVSRPVADTGEPGLTSHDAWLTGTFWILFCAFILLSASVHGCFTHIASILADRGIPEKSAAFITSLFGVGLLTGRTGLAYMLDRFFGPRVAFGIFLSTSAGVAFLWLTRSQESAAAASFLVGVGMGAEVDVMAYLTSRYFGLRAFASIYGIIFAGFVLAGGLGVYLMGAIFDAKGSYSGALALFVFADVVAAALMLRLGPYRYNVLPAGAIDKRTNMGEK